MARKPKPHIPQTAEELHAEWFSSTLGPAHGGAQVTAVEREVIGVGIGFVGDLFRCRLTWDRDDPALPRSVVAKVPTMVKENRALGEGLMAYEREILIYSGHQGQLGIPMPAHVHSEMDPNPAPWLLKVVEFLMDHLPLRGINWLINRLLSLPESAMRRFLLVIEDIDDARPASQFDGGSLDDAHQALEVLARFHAANWMNEALLEREPLIWSIARNPKVFQASYLRNRPEFEEQFGDLLGPDVLTRLDELQKNVPALTGRLVEEPWTILHGDYRLDNIMYRHNGEIVVLDYQLLARGRPGWDVGYFITTALSPDHRAEEAALLQTYHQALLAEGVTDYSHDALLKDVSLTKDLLAHRMVGTGDVMNTQVEGRSETFVELMVTRVTGWLD